MANILYGAKSDKAREHYLNALNIESDARNLSFLNNESIIKDKIKIGDLDILFKKIT